ncbi:MAG: MerR family transcriptional regulator, partial [Lapillicoccus sp.]
MIAKELADLTDTTVRTIRYYHQIGLLPIPGTRGARRSYDLSHVARLTRIRWLTSAGIPLSRIAGMLESTMKGPGGDDGGRSPILVDLESTVVAIDDRLEQLRGQRDQIQRLIDSVQRSDVLSPMPPIVARFYDEMEHEAGDEKVRRIIRQERDFMELAYYRGDMPPEAELL